eukprot:CAMPEP_0116926612 /NCGR_PEP_ID=MMETSP0467-20121206/24829_1 /TAXON_ID=283647 /ORGANISM="Mesodinium pulex, Strain SPMC105" /LENGTH=69 /DNA_ID=CAMNT_0004605903 /DNA_START=569 /DNA_END=778 /DNA_ORIENTATION=+
MALSSRNWFLHGLILGAIIGWAKTNYSDIGFNHGFARKMEIDFDGNVTTGSNLKENMGLLYGGAHGKGI